MNSKSNRNADFIPRALRNSAACAINRRQDAKVLSNSTSHYINWSNFSP